GRMRRPLPSPSTSVSGRRWKTSLSATPTASSRRSVSRYAPMQMCAPLSRSPPCETTSRARPPGVGAISKSVTWAPARVASTAAASPAQPAPTTAMPSAGITAQRGGSSPAPVRLHRDPELPDRRQRDALVQDGEVVGLDLAQQAAVDVGHHQPRLLRGAIGIAQQRDRLVVGAVRALGLEAHQGREAVAVGALEDLGGLDVELLELVHGQVDAVAARV